jgi:4-carboxymuconolactone decarboxylase
VKLIIPVAAALVLVGPAQAQEPTSVAPRAMQAITPALADYTDEVLYGDVWRRPGLQQRDRSLVTVAILVATGKTAQLEGHLGRALDNGVRPSEIAGLITHMAFYSGWPNAVSSLEVVERVFTKRGVDPAAMRTTAPPLPVPTSDAALAHQVEEQTASLAPKLAQLTNGVLLDDIWRHTDLSPRDRSLVTIAALAANGDNGQLAFYVQRGLENGLTRGEIGEALTHLAFYAGWPKATAAVALAAKAFGRIAEAMPEADGGSLRVVHPDTAPVPGSAEHFTGVVTVTSDFQGTGGARIGGATVTFQPGARTNWHIHPRGQFLIITAGRGWVQVEGEPVRTIGPGDVVWTPPGVKHWHGATRTSAMKHVAVAEAQDGSTVEWLGPVSDAQYRSPE